jgi:hypothetical protein
MGLLDEAIRDHLELKRRRGADPSEIAQAEQDALEPVFPPEEEGADEAPVPGAAETHAEAPDLVAEPEPQSYDEVPVADAAPAQQPAGEEHPAAEAGPDFSSVGQETAEIDMAAVLNEHHELVGDSRAEPPAVIDEEMLEWESAPRGAGPQTESMAVSPNDSHSAEEPQIPGQERLSFE